LQLIIEAEGTERLQHFLADDVNVDALVSAGINTKSEILQYRIAQSTIIELSDNYRKIDKVLTLQANKSKASLPKETMFELFKGILGGNAVVKKPVNTPKTPQEQLDEITDQTEKLNTKIDSFLRNLKDKIRTYVDDFSRNEHNEAPAQNKSEPALPIPVEANHETEPLTDLEKHNGYVEKSIEYMSETLRTAIGLIEKASGTKNLEKVFSTGTITPALKHKIVQGIKACFEAENKASKGKGKDFEYLVRTLYEINPFGQKDFAGFYNYLDKMQTDRGEAPYDTKKYDSKVQEALSIARVVHSLFNGQSSLNLRNYFSSSKQ